MQLGIDPEFQHVTAVRHGGRARPVGRQLQLLGQTGQRLRPVGDLAGEQAVGVVLVAQDLVLPQGVVAVGHGQRWPCRCPATLPGGVGGGQVTGERTHGPAVPDDVVHDQQQHMLVRCESEQLRPKRHLRGQVEAAHRRLAQQCGHLPFAGRAHGQGDGDLGCVEHSLVRNSAGVREDRAQGLVPGHHVHERGAQCGPVEVSGQPQGQRHVIGGARRAELLEEPEPALGERQRHQFAAGPGHQSLPRGSGAVQPGRQSGGGRRPEQRAQLQFDPQGRPEPRDQPGGEQGVPAQLEEVLVDPDSGETQHLCEHLAQDLLLRRARRPAAGGRARIRRGQRRPVELAVRRQRQRVEQHERGRNHVIRHPVTQEHRQRRRDYPVRVRGDDVRDDPVLPGEYHDLGHARVRGQLGLDLTGLDPEPAHLDLVVHPAGEIQLAVGTPAHQVTGAVHPRARRPERIGDEAPGSQTGLVQVAARQPRSGQVQLAQHTGSHRSQRRIQHVRLAVGDGTADRHRQRAVGRVGRKRVGGDHMGFGGPVVVVQHPARPAGLEAAHGTTQPHGLSGLGDQPQVRQVKTGLLGCLGQRLDHQIRREQLLDPVPVQPVGEQLRAAALLLGRHHEGLPVQQRGQHLLHRDVEADRGELSRARAGFATDGPVVPLQQIQQSGGGHRDGLGPAGGTGGVDDVGRVPGVHGDGRIVLRQLAGRCDGREVVEHDGRAGVLQHVRDAGGRVVRVDRQIRRARLEYREDGNHQLGRTRQSQGDDLLRAHASGDQCVGQAVGPAVQLAVGQHGVLEHHGRGLGRRPGPRLEERGQGGVGRWAGRVVAGDQQLVALLGGEDVDPAQRTFRVGDHCRQQPQPPGDQCLHRGSVEQVGAVLDPPDDALGRPPGAAALQQVQAEVEHRRRRPNQHDLGGQTAQLELGAGHVLQREQYLEQRLSGERPGRIEGLDDMLERQVLVCVRAESPLPDPDQQLGEGRIAAGVRAEHQGVDEEPDEVVQRLVGPARDQAADRDVRTRTELVQQRCQAGLQHHVHAGAVLPAQPDQAGVKFRVQLDGQVAAGGGRCRGAMAVGGKPDLLRQVRECPRPVVGLTGGQAVGVGRIAEQPVLPQGVVGVLHGQRRPLRRPALAACRVRGGQVGGQRAQRPAVTGDVVHHKEQDVLVRRDLEDLGTQRWFGGEVETARSGLRQQFRRHRPVGRGDRQLRVRLFHGEYSLVGHAVGGREDRAQGFVPAGEVAQRRFKSRQVQRSGKPPRERHVVDRFGALQLAQEPEPALSGRQRHQLGPLRPPEGEPGPVRVAQPGSQPGHGRGSEQGGQGQFHAQRRTDARHQPRSEQGVPAEVEEVVVDTDLRQAQHLGEQAGQHVFVGRARCPAGRCLGGLRLGQGAPVQLAVRGQRQRVEGDERARHHVLRQPLAQMSPQVLRPELSPGGGLQIGDQAGALRPVLPDDHGGPRDPRVLGEDRLDFPEFDPEAADLDLVVGAAEELQVPVRVPPHQVARAVHPRAARTERVGHEPSRGQARPVQIAARQARTRDVQLTRHIRGHGPQRGVEHMQPDTAERPADHLA
ncbi:hypothetical protein EES39_32280 [Streptomyces sp. ADI92-24]|nr:hypothetical protein EES39_32280 [Streptomyces sp. ADI92-24]